MSVLPPVYTEGLTHENVTDLTESVRCSMMNAFDRITEEVEERAKAKNNHLLLESSQQTPK